jgi:glycosyltransferase involved in cell wall biosynthesis
MIKEKTKIVWICHFNSEEMQKNYLPLWKKSDEISPWIPNMLKGFESKDNIEIHVISPQDYLKKSTNLIIRNIHYHFIPYGIPFWHRHWPEFFLVDAYLNFYFFRRKVNATINRIQPDLINLIGAENAHYSSTILDIGKEYPTLITIQGFFSQMKDSIKLNFYRKKRIDIEERILKIFKYYAGEQDSSTYISNYNPNHIFFRLFFPVNEILVSNTIELEKKYDCIYFGALTKLKGAEDFVKVIAEIKSKMPLVKACIIGGGNINNLQRLAKELKCYENIEFVGFIKTQEELFKFVIASKVFLTPPYFERLSSTIREAMLLKVPIVAYATGGIPYINEVDEYIYLVKTGDYKEMARKTILLLEDESLRINLADKAYKYASQEYSLKVNIERTITAYYTILTDNKKQIII